MFVNVTDVNDNYPRFALPRDPLVTSVNEFQPAGAVVATVKAFDKDTGNHSLITYGLKNLYNPYSGDFQIHRTLGTITTTKELLHSQGATRSFVVTATDSSHPFRKAEAKVVVMINRAIPPPQFDKEEFAEFIPENIHVGKYHFFFFIFTVVIEEVAFPCYRDACDIWVSHKNHTTDMIVQRDNASLG